MASFADLITFSRSTVAWYWDTNGNLVQAAIDEPRFDYTATSGYSAGLLLEPSATEGNKYTKATIANTGVVGSPTRTDLTLNALGQFPGLRIASAGVITDSARLPTTANATACTNGVPRVIEIYYRAGTSGNIRVTVANFTTSTSSIVSGTIGSATVTSSGAGSLTIVSDSLLKDGLTRRMRLRFTPSADGNFTFNVGPNSTTVGQDIIYLGAFTQVGSVFTTPIFTNGSAVTRAADVAYVTNVSTWFDKDNGTFFGSFRVSYEDNGLAAEVPLFRLNSGAYNSLGHSVYLDTSGTSTGKPIYRLETASGVTTVGGGSTEFSPGINLSIKAGVSYSTTVARLCFNGGTVASDIPSGSLPDLSSYSMVLGGGSPITVLNLNYKPSTTSSADLQTLTT